jgi:hypothetical protein
VELKVRKAHNVEDATITIEGEGPLYNGDVELDAEELEFVLSNSLPFGTYRRLARLMVESVRELDEEFVKRFTELSNI